MNNQVQGKVRFATTGQRLEFQLALTRALWPIVDMMNFEQAEKALKNQKHLKEMLRNGLVPNLKIDLDKYSSFAGYHMWKYRKEDQLKTRMSGEWWWDASQMTLLSPVLDQARHIESQIFSPEAMEKSFGRKFVFLGSAIVDFLSENPHLIPDPWIGKTIYFIGDMYWDGKYGGRHCLLITPDPSRSDRPLLVQHLSIDRVSLHHDDFIAAIRK